MTKILMTIFFLGVFPIIVVAQNQKLPESCRKILDKNFRGWMMASVSPDIQKFLRRNSPRKNNGGNLIAGDWNGDGARDYAVLIKHGFDTLNDGAKLARNVSVAFVSGQKGFKHFILDTSGDYIAFEKKGKSAYDFETQSGIRFSNDAIAVGLWEKSARSYVWRKNKFIYFATSD